MDTSEQYIEKCKKAVEVQAQRPIPTIIGENFWHYPEDVMLADITWLPRQDQLQEMVIEQCTDIEEPWPDKTWNMLTGFMDFCGGLVNWGDASMEQLWLAFCMAEGCGKYWDGNEWVEDGGER